MQAGARRKEAKPRVCKIYAAWYLPDMNNKIRRLGVLAPNVPGCGIVVVLLPDVACIFRFEKLVRYAVDVSV
jgi:hypothetical protein